MRIREYTAADLARVKQLAHGAAFELPDLRHPLVIVKSVLEDDDGAVRMAAFGRLHVSALLYVDPEYKTPEFRLAAIRELQKEMDGKASALGLDIATTQAEGRFAERLEKDLGWIRGFGQMFYREV